MDKVAFKKTHQKYVDDLNKLAEATKAEVTKKVLTSIDLNTLLANPKKYEGELKKAFLSSFVGYWKKSVKMGATFGHQVVKDAKA